MPTGSELDSLLLTTIHEIDGLTDDYQVNGVQIPKSDSAPFKFLPLHLQKWSDDPDVPESTIETGAKMLKVKKKKMSRIK